MIKIMSSDTAPDAAENLAEGLWELWRVWRRRSHPARRGEVTAEQYFLLRRLERCGPLPVSTLARELGVTSATVTVATRRLEAAGFVCRTRGSEDQRIVTVALAPQGAEAVRRWARQRRQALVELLAPLGAEDRVALARMLATVLVAGGGERGGGEGS